MENKSQDKVIKRKVNDLVESNRKSLARDIAGYVIGIKTVGYTVKELPKAIAKKREGKQKGENVESIFEYMEFPEMDLSKEKERISKKIYEGLEKTEKLMSKINLLYGIKFLYKKVSAIIKDRKTKKLSSGKNEEQANEDNIEKVEGKRYNLKQDLTKNVPSLDEQKKYSNKILSDNTPKDKKTILKDKEI